MSEFSYELPIEEQKAAGQKQSPTAQNNRKQGMGNEFTKSSKRPVDLLERLGLELAEQGILPSVEWRHGSGENLF